MRPLPITEHEIGDRATPLNAQRHEPPDARRQDGAAETPRSDPREQQENPLLWTTHSKFNTRAGWSQLIPRPRAATRHARL